MDGWDGWLEGMNGWMDGYMDGWMVGEEEEMES